MVESSFRAQLCLLASLATASCGPSDGQPSPSACDLDRGLMPVDEVLDDAEDDCREWVEMLHGRAVRVDRGGGSGSIWSRRTEHGTALMTTAAHVLSPCWAAPGSECLETFHDPKLVTPEAGIRLASIGGGTPMSFWSAHFALYNPSTPAGELQAAEGRPRYDMAVYAVDSQVFEAWGTGLGIEPEPIIDALLPLHDPEQLTLATPTWASANPGAAVLLLGYPALEDYDPRARQLHASVGRVLGDDEAEQAIEALRMAGDEEGNIPYDREAEFLFEGHALPGMSGGGVFDEDGLQIGIAVRASFAEIGVQYVRAVRMSYLVELMDAGFSSLTAEDQAAVGPYLEDR
jgi:hypothetical protein